MRIVLSFCLIFVNHYLSAQDTTEKFIIRTYGFPSWDDYDQITDSVSEKWGIYYRAVAGCIVTDQFVDSIEQLNDLTYQKLETVYGKDWKERLISEIDSSYRLLLEKKETTYETIAVCRNSSYYFQAKRNLSGKQTKIEIANQYTGDKKENNIKVTGLQNTDPTVVYRGYPNKMEIEFSSAEDTLSFNLRCKGSLYLADSCLTTNKIHFTYYAQSSYDTLFIEKPNGESLQHIFTVKNLDPPHLMLNNHTLDSTFSIKQWKDINEISVEQDKDVLIQQGFSIVNWEIIVHKQSYKGSGNIIPLEVSKKLKKLHPGTTISLYILVKASDSVLRKKAVTFKLI